MYFYLGPRQRAQVAAREPKILTRIVEVVEAAGWQVVLLPEEGRHAAPSMDGYHMVLNHPVPRPVPGQVPVFLSVRPCYFEPFWRIDKVNDRWAWDPTGLEFDARDVRAPYVQQFYARWRGTLVGDGPISRQGFVFVPLQDQVLRHRQFQSMSPMAMLDTLLAMDTRPVVATLHPNVNYPPDELAALQSLAAQNPRFTLSSQPSIDLLRQCDLLVTQHSSMALTGYFAAKPAVLFAMADFHHIAGSVPRDGVAEAFAGRPANVSYAAYLYWFFKMHAITVWSDDVHTQVAARLRQLGWPV